MVCAAGRHSGTSPSQSYALGSTTTLFIAMAALSPGSLPPSIVILRHNDALPYGSSNTLVGSNRNPRIGLRWGHRHDIRKSARTHAWDEHVPIVVRVIDHGIESNGVGWSAVVFVVEEEELDGSGGARKEADLDSALQ